MSIIKKLQKQIIKVEGLDTILDTIAEGCRFDEGEGQGYNGIRIDEDTILVLMSYFDRHTNLTEYFHYSISKDKLVKLDYGSEDDKYRDLFEDCNMLDYDDCFFIIAVEPIPIGDSEIIYGDEYNDTIVNLDVVHTDVCKLQGSQLYKKDEPKCTKCGSKFEEEIWKTDGLEYEDYICSNEKCCAVHQINIDRGDEEDGEVNIERDWSSLEFSYIWTEGIKMYVKKSLYQSDGGIDNE